MDKLVEQMGIKGISKSQVSEMSKVLDAQVVASLEAKHPDAAEHLDAAREDLLAFTGFPNLKAERPDWLEREQAVQAEVRRRNSASSSSASSPDSRDASGRAHRRSQGRPRGSRRASAGRLVLTATDLAMPPPPTPLTATSSSAGRWRRATARIKSDS